jgi:rhodanese-related sulfurtransferase
MAANNETGVVSDVAAIERLVLAADSTATHRVLWLVDCVQALGKLDLNLHASRIDYAPFSGHKLYAPKGIGMLYVRRGAPFTALMAGGGQEGGRRSGTENMAGIAAFGAVLKECLQGTSFANHATLLKYRNTLEATLRNAFPGVQFNAPLAQCLPTTLNFSVPGVSSKTLIDVLDAASVCVSAGSACSAAKALPSYVLDAMGLPEWRTTSAIRMSFGPLVTAATIEDACAAIVRCAQALATSVQAIAVVQADMGQVVDMPVEALQWAEVDAFIMAHPDATLVDVREASEHALSNGVECAGKQAVNTPLSALPETASQWLVQQSAPVVFVCRSGNRSLKAAQWLQAQGHTKVRHIQGGLASRPV